MVLRLLTSHVHVFHLLYLSTPTLYFNVFPKPQFSLCSQISHNSFSFQSPTFVVQFLLCWCQLLNDHAKSEDVFPEVSVAISEVILWNTTLLKASHPQTGKQLSTTSTSKPGFRITLECLGDPPRALLGFKDISPDSYNLNYS